MSTAQPTVLKVYLDLPPQLQRVLRTPVTEVLRGQGLELPPGIGIGEEALPAAPNGVRDRDWGTVISAAPELVLALGTATSMVILALSQFLRDRERGQGVLEVCEVLEVTGPDGLVQRVVVRNPVLVEPGPELQVALDAHLKTGQGLLVRFKADA